MAGTTRRRGPALEDAILRAAADELTEHGYAGLTVEAVARRAGTNKNAIYRRWPGRAALGVAAYRHLMVADVELPDEGDLRGDVLALLRGVNCDWSSPAGVVLRSLMAGVADDPELLASLRSAASDGGAQRWLRLLARARTRGEIPDGPVTSRMATVALDLLRNEFVTRGVRTVPDETIVEIVDEVYLPLLRHRQPDVRGNQPAASAG
ncbi:TetR/AcrR family transcriptional regulator [Micromonospora cathayae]|uniref:TetR/AcrR family transcriptional regulator n=1 Tax=Micromonospora cathayae TaxID=3028804 RepID=A0ABY7ZT73_9ACTN|nr:TetR/AcrR family transcriptional regulator [Micromonospora sp. HUAS 3]WDZ86100.1 TetR/AcrR family transcriptional regulator [Micromonospora sp. HUAS 3]